MTYIPGQSGVFVCTECRSKRGEGTLYFVLLAIDEKHNFSREARYTGCVVSYNGGPYLTGPNIVSKNG